MCLIAVNSNYNNVMQSHAHSGSGQDIITSGQSYTQFMGWQTFHTVTSQKWRDARRLKNLLPDSVEGTFPACLFFSVEIFFFFLVSPNALAICLRLPRGQRSSVCRQTLSTSPAPLFPQSLSPTGPQTGLCESHYTNDQCLGSTPPPSTSIPAWDTFCSHPPHTVAFCAR